MPNERLMYHVWQVTEDDIKCYLHSSWLDETEALRIAVILKGVVTTEPIISDLRERNAA